MKLFEARNSISGSEELIQLPSFATCAEQGKVVFQNLSLAVFHIQCLCKILRLEMARIHHGGDDGDDDGG
jgi:hypothetical protein